MMKGYKVTDGNRGRLVGVACESLEELLTKGKQKLGIKEHAIAALDDGTIVDDEEYFKSIPAQTIIVLYRRDENIVTGVDWILSVLRRVNTSYLDMGSKAREFLLTKTNELLHMLKEDETEVKIFKNTPEEDPDWFADLETNARTKDEYMFKKSQDRIRGYFYKFQNDIRKSEQYVGDGHFRKIAKDCLEFLKNQLRKDEFFGCYFDRRCAAKNSDGVNSHSKKRRREIYKLCRKKRRKDGEISLTYDKFSYCDQSGKFVCQGKWKLESCEFMDEHQINPYLSKASRIFFSTWNFDHRYSAKFFRVITFVVFWGFIICSNS